MTTTTVDLQIVRFHNCTKCIRKVERTLCGFLGVKLLDVDPENGKFTIETTRHPEEIRDALQRKFAGKSVILSKRISHSNPFSALDNPRNSSIQGPLNFHEMAEALVKVSRGKGLQNVEYTQSTTIKFNFNDQPTTSGSATTPENVWDSEDGGYVNVPPPPPPPPLPRYQPTTSRSARRPENDWGSSGSDVGHGYVPQPPPPPPPPPPRYQPTTSGSTWPLENVWGSGGAHNKDFGYGYVPQPPPPPPLPPRYQPTTSGSTWLVENVWGSGGAHNEDFGYGRVPPAPPRTTTEPSAPLIPSTEGQGHVYGYPIELYGFSASTEEDSSCGCCTIL